MRSVHSHCLAEVLEVHSVFPFFGLGHDGSEAVPPEHLLGDVGRPHLAGGTGGLHGAIQKHHQLKVLLQEGFCCHVEEGAVLVYDVVNGEGRDEEEILVAGVHNELNVDLVQDDGLPLGGDGGLEQLPVDVAPDQQALAEVGHADQEAQLPPTLADDGVLAERDGLGSVFGPGDLGQDGPTHEGVDDDAQDGLEDEQEDGSGTLLRDTPEAIPDGHLGLQGEEEGRGEAVDVLHAGGVVDGGVELGQVFVDVGHDVPEQPKQEPAAQEGGDEDGQLIPPPEVQDGCPYVNQEDKPGLLHVAKLDVAPAILGDEPGAAPAALPQVAGEAFPEVAEHPRC